MFLDVFPATSTRAVSREAPCCKTLANATFNFGSDTINMLLIIWPCFSELCFVSATAMLLESRKRLQSKFFVPVQRIANNDAVKHEKWC